MCVCVCVCVCVGGGGGGVSQASYSQLMKTLIILEPDGISRSNFAYLLLSHSHCSDTSLHNGDGASLRSFWRVEVL